MFPNLQQATKNDQFYVKKVLINTGVVFVKVKQLCDLVEVLLKEFIP